MDITDLAVCFRNRRSNILDGLSHLRRLNLSDHALFVDIATFSDTQYT
jgi:hypothetical protein